MMRRKILIVVAGIICLGLGLAISPVCAADNPIELKVANFLPPQAKFSTIIDEFINDVETRTGGRIKLRYFKGGSLLSGPGMYKGIETGVADIGYAHVYYTPNRMPVTEAAGLPLGYPSAWVSSRVLTDFYHKLKPKEWDTVEVLWLNAASPSFIISKQPIRKLDDLKGLTIRAPGVPGEIIKALGGTPAPTPMMETYDAIAKGVIHGTYAPYEALKSFRFAEIVKYATVSWQVGNTYPWYMAMNKNSYKKLPADLKEIFDKLCGEYSERYALMWNEIEFTGKNYGAEKGMEFIELSDTEVVGWKNAVSTVIDDYIKRMVDKGFSKEQIKDWISYLRERIDYYTKKQIEYRIPSPSGPAAMKPENIGK